MAVYTVLQPDEIAKLIEPYRIGPLRSAEAIAEGVENTNYFVTTEHTEPANRCVLTVFEEITTGDLERYLDWLDQLYEAGLPVAAALRDCFGTRIRPIEGKPAALFPRLPGRHPVSINAERCAVIGEALGRIHTVAAKVFEYEGPRGGLWLDHAVASITPQIGIDDRELIDTVIGAFGAISAGLPEGLIHGDLFIDNTLFDDNLLTGLLDFFRGGRGPLLLDLAITGNAWCSDREHWLDSHLTAALVAGYQRCRPLTAAEVASWPATLEYAALCFWVSRLAGRLSPGLDHRPGALVEQHDPEQFRSILLRHREHPATLR